MRRVWKGVVPQGIVSNIIPAQFFAKVLAMSLPFSFDKSSANDRLFRLTER